MTDTTNYDNMAPDFGAHSQGQSENDIIALARSQTGIEAPDPTAAPAQAAPPAAPNPIGDPAANLDFETAKKLADAQVGAKAADVQSAVVKDVAVGLTESPKAVWNGFHDAVQANANMAREFGSWVTGGEAAKHIELPFKASDTTTVTGGLVHGTAQFLSGLYGAGKLQKGIEGYQAAAKAFEYAGPHAMSAIRGATAMFSSFEAHDKNLADLIEAHPSLSNPVTDFLASDPSDNAAVGRAKQALTGMLPGVLADGMVKGLRTMRAGLDARMAAKAAAHSQVHPENVDWSILGDHTSTDGVIAEPVAPAPAAAPAGKKGTPATPAAPVTPDQVLAGGAPAVEPRPLHAMTIDEINNFETTQAADEHAAAVKAFGDEAKAKSVLRGLNSNNDSVFKAAEAEVEKLPDDVRAELEQKIYYSGHSQEAIREYQTAHSDVLMADTPEEMATSLRKTLTDIGDADPANLDKATPTQQVAMKKLQWAYERIKSEGWDQAAISENALKQAAGRFSDPADAEFMLQRFIKSNEAQLKDQTAKSSATGGDATPAAAADPVTATGNPRLQINFATINTADDAKRVMQNMVDHNAETIQAARRGVRTWEDTRLSASEENAFKLIQERRTGEVWNAEQTYAARQLWASSGKKVAEVATAAGMDGSTANLAVFQKMVAVHHAINEMLMGARAEVGRSQNSWAISVEGTGKADMLQKLIDQNGGTVVTQRFAKYVAAAYEMKNPQLAEELIQKGRGQKTSEAIAQVWMNGLLNAMPSHTANFLSNVSTLFQSMYESAGAAKMAELFGAQDSVQHGEALARMFGAVEGVKAGFRVSARGRQVLQSAAGALFRGDLKGGIKDIAANGDEFGNVWATAASNKSRFDMHEGGQKVVFGEALSPEAWNQDPASWQGRALRGINFMTSYPGRAMFTADEFFKSMNYHSSLAALSLRQAAADMRTAGNKDPAALKARVAELRADPPEVMKADALYEAHYNTFTQKPAALPNSIVSAWQKIPVLGRVTAAFKDTPINAFNYGLERTPMAPLVKSWREDIAAGGARMDTALTRAALGTATFLAAMDMALTDKITGEAPTEPTKKAEWDRLDYRPYSRKVGDYWVAYNRLDSVGLSLGMAADIATLLTNSEAPMEDHGPVLNGVTSVGMAIGGSVLAMGHNALNRSYMSGMADFIAGVDEGGASSKGARWASRTIGSVVPANWAASAREADPYMRVANDWVDVLKRRWPGIHLMGHELLSGHSTELAPTRDLWGRAKPFASGLGEAYDHYVPYYAHHIGPQPVDVELKRLGYFPSEAPKSFTVDGNQGPVEVDLKNEPNLYAEFQRLAGNGTKVSELGGLGCMDYLNQVVQGQGPDGATYKQHGMTDGPHGTRALTIQKAISDFRKQAAQEMLKNPKFKAIFDEAERATLQQAGVR